MRNLGNELSSSPPNRSEKTPPHRRGRYNNGMIPSSEVPALGYGSSSPIFESPTTVRHPGRTIFHQGLDSSPPGGRMMLPSSPPEQLLDGSPRPRAKLTMPSMQGQQFMPMNTNPDPISIALQPPPPPSSSSSSSSSIRVQTTTTSPLGTTPRKRASRGKVAKTPRQNRMKPTQSEFHQVHFPVPTQPAILHMTPPAGPLVFVEQPHNFQRGFYGNQLTPMGQHDPSPNHPTINTKTGYYPVPSRPSHSFRSRASAGPSSADFRRACSWTESNRRSIQPSNSSLKFVVDQETGRAAIASHQNVRPLDSRSRELILAEDSDSDNEGSTSSVSSSGNSMYMSSPSLDSTPTRTVGRKAICDAAVAFARILTRSRLGMAKARGRRMADTPNRNISGQSNFFYPPPSTPARADFQYPPVTPRAPVQLMNLRQLSTQTPPGAVLGYDSLGMFATGLTPYLPHSVS